MALGRRWERRWMSRNDVLGRPYLAGGKVKESFRLGEGRMEKPRATPGLLAPG